MIPDKFNSPDFRQTVEPDVIFRRPGHTVAMGIQSALSRIEGIPGLGRIAPSSSILPSAEAMEGHRCSQRLAYDCALATRKLLKEGMTEKEAAKLLYEYLSDHGARVFLHRPFAWFGDHSRFDGYKWFTDFRPGNRRLKADDVVILDVSPVLDGYAGDIGYTCSLNPSPELKRAQEFLLELRHELPGMFASEMRTGAIWAAIDERVRMAGYDNCHALYPFRVLGHRLNRLPLGRIKLPLIPVSFISWFSLQAQWGFLSRGIFPEILGPEHDGAKTGIWAIEPHIGGAGFGAKFEEILVVEPGHAYWLDDQVPHVLESETEKNTKTKTQAETNA